MGKKLWKILHNFRYNDKVQKHFFCILTVIYGIIFHWNYIRSVIPAQTGWWQYMAWRMSEGELPYRDFYLYLPPYFIIFTSFLFNIFGKQFIYYTLMGLLITRVLMWIMLYKMMINVFKPVYVFGGIITGLSITAAYSIDQMYDYNPLITCGVVAIAFFLFKLSNCKNRNKFFFVFIVGMLCGCMIMMKQTVAIFCPLVSLVCIIIIFWKEEHKLRFCLKGVMFWNVGLVLAVIPGVTYLSVNHLWNDFTWCISSALAAKVSNTGFLTLCFKNFIRWNELICAFAIVLNYNINKKYKNRENTFVILCSRVLLAMLLFSEFSENIISFKVFAGYKFTKYIAVFLICVIALSLIDYLFREIDSNAELLVVFIIIAFIVFISLIKKYIVVTWSDFLYNGIDFSNFKTKLLYIGIYISIFIWLHATYSSFVLKREAGQKVFASFTFGLLYLGCSFASFSLEELYAVIFISISISYLFEFGLNSRMAKWISILACFMMCVLCLNQKIYLPYSWHGWQSTTLVENRALNYSEVEGLEGFILSENDEKTYSDIISLIHANSTKDDVMFQFANIPLFNVLAERKCGYVPIPYFDVCPDNVAESVAISLEKDNPVLILFHEMDEWRWILNEDVYRNGKRCGQRSILEFYNSYVKLNYRLLGVFSNNMNENICLWKKTIFNGGYVDQSLLIKANQPIRQKMNFSDSTFSKIAIQRLEEDDMTDIEIHLTLKNLTKNNIVFEDSYTLSEAEGNYYVCDVGEHTVDKNDLYELCVVCNDNKKHNFGFSSQTNGKYEATINGKKMNMILGVTID